MKIVHFIIVSFLIIGFSGCSTNHSTFKMPDHNINYQENNVSVDNSEDLREDTNYAKNDSKAYTFYDKQHNLKVIKTLNEYDGTKIIDNNIWIYTQEFAKRFAMPSRWIGKDDFKGALALAYRQEIYKVKDCGYFRDMDNCREFSNQCVLDVYVPHDSKTIPWNTKAQYGDSYGGGMYSSRFWLRPYNTKDGKDMEYKSVGVGYLESKKEILTEQSYKDLIAYRGFEGDGLGITSVSTAHRFKADGFGVSTDAAKVRSFHRNVLDGIDLITIEGICNFASSGSSDMQLWLDGKRFDESQEEFNFKVQKNVEFLKSLPSYDGRNYVHKNLPYGYTLYPSGDFMQRVKVYQEENKKHSFFEYFKKNMSKKKEE